jgi:GTPase
LINHLLGEERLLTSAEAGTTRDSISVEITWQGREFQVFDTAGLRRRSRIEEKLEKLSVADALRAVRFAEVVVLMMDAQNKFEEQDLRIADLIEREGRALVIAVNKWDLIQSARVLRIARHAGARHAARKGQSVCPQAQTAVVRGRQIIAGMLRSRDPRIARHRR